MKVAAYLHTIVVRKNARYRLRRIGIDANTVKRLPNAFDNPEKALEAFLSMIGESTSEYLDPSDFISNARVCRNQAASQNIVQIAASYHNRIASFLNFLNTMRGKYHQATYAEKRNALEVPGVKAIIRATFPEITLPDDVKEWLSSTDIAGIGVGKQTLKHYIRKGVLKPQTFRVPTVVMKVADIIAYLQTKQQSIEYDFNGHMWVVSNKVEGLLSPDDFQEISRLVKTRTMHIPHSSIHKEELRRFLQETTLKPQDRQVADLRITVTYDPVFISERDVIERFIHSDESTQVYIPA